MKIIVDTQVFAWIVEANSRLGTEAYRAIKDTSNELYISYFSFFEMTIKASIGKLKYEDSILDDLPVMGIELILPDTKELRDYHVFAPNNKDPFDNVLIATALNKKLIFMTSDQKILRTNVDGLRLMDATK